MQQGIIINLRKGFFQRKVAATAKPPKADSQAKQDDMDALMRRQKRAAVLTWSLTSGRPLGHFHKVEPKRPFIAPSIR